ncbi:HNH endonuclease signature motif containing protein [Luteimonas saliphila]|uniref:HNH endonuclease signature motif containing protein n=1 Tax=Luteimonas saliphila TaxID=2804919 RepID=UPI002352E926|nr:HNH endonuclease [Luteimonas saliphila]
MESACLEWQGATSIGGYGKGKWYGRTVAAHRAAWEDANGPIPAGKWVLHRCDNPLCCRVSHLFIGTPQENSADMVAKGRARNGSLSGETRHRIAVDERPHREIADEYGITQTTVYRIKQAARRAA